MRERERERGGRNERRESRDAACTRYDLGKQRLREETSKGEGRREWMRYGCCSRLQEGSTEQKGCRGRIEKGGHKVGATLYRRLKAEGLREHSLTRASVLSFLPPFFAWMLFFSSLFLRCVPPIRSLVMDSRPNQIECMMNLSLMYFCMSSNPYINIKSVIKVIKDDQQLIRNEPWLLDIPSQAKTFSIYLWKIHCEVR